MQNTSCVKSSTNLSTSSHRIQSTEETFSSFPNIFYHLQNFPSKPSDFLRSVSRSRIKLNFIPYKPQTIDRHPSIWSGSGLLSFGHCIVIFHWSLKYFKATLQKCIYNIILFLYKQNNPHKLFLYYDALLSSAHQSYWLFIYFSTSLSWLSSHLVITSKTASNS